MNRLYYGCDGRSIDHLLGGGHVDHVLISAVMLWRKNKFVLPKRLPEYDTLFLDSGGFSFFHRSGEYPFTVEQYATLAREMNPDHVAVMDYPCEPSIDRSAYESNHTRIEATIANSRACQEHDDLPWVQVVQGYSPDEYRRSIQWIRWYGLETPVMAVGTICTRTTPASVLPILRLVAEAFPAANLHGFGVDLRLIRDRRVRQLLWSADTTAWRMNPTHGNRYPKGAAAFCANYARYRRTIDRILAGDLCQTEIPCAEVPA